MKQKKCYVKDATCYCIKDEYTKIASTHKRTDWRKDGKVYYYHVEINWKSSALIDCIRTDSGHVDGEVDKLKDIHFCPFCGRNLEEDLLS